MLRRFSINFAIFSMFVDAGLTVVALMLAVFLRPYLPNFPYLVPVGSITLSSLLYIIVPALWIFAFLLTSVYDPRRNYRIVEEFQALLLGNIVASFLFAGVLYLGFRNFSRWLFITFVIIDIIFLFGWRLIFRIIFKVFFKPAKERKIVIVGSGEVGQRIGELVTNFTESGLFLIGYIDDKSQVLPGSGKVLGSIHDAREIMERYEIDDVIVALPQRAFGKINQLILSIQDLPINIRIVPDYFSLALYRASVEDFGGLPLINLRDPALNQVQRFIKRIFDILVSGVLIFFAFPMFVVAATLIRLDSAGPILLRQDRIGENGRLFKMFKFRTMVPNAEKMQSELNETTPDGKLFFKKRNDPRVTRIGAFLRRTSLDETPQLLNVFLGDMSLVGPRPELPWVVETYEPWQHKRFAVPQGMTGWWQVNGRANKPMHLNTEDDIFYVQNYSFWMDIYILLKTPWVVLRGKGAF
jgi:exopolysaccharide biosynthesis polyprenyl glycosylphosphotransferase